MFASNLKFCQVLETWGSIPKRESVDCFVGVSTPVCGSPRIALWVALLPFCVFGGLIEVIRLA